MNEQEYTGNAGQFRNSEFTDATEDLAGYTRLAPLEITVEKAVICNGVIDKNGRKEDGVFAIALVGAKRRMRVNATKRKMLIAAADTAAARKWGGLKLRLYQTVDSDRMTGGKTRTNAIGMDVYSERTGKWLRYWDYQQPKGKKHVQDAGLTDNWEVLDIDTENTGEQK